jgi:glycosyltransferase involved in cell wall biosynthesis
MKVGINGRAFTADEPGGAVQTGIKMSQGLIRSERAETLLFGSPSVSSVLQTEIDSTLCWTDSALYGLVWERTVVPRRAAATDVDVLYCPNHNGPLHKIPCPVVVCVHDVGAERGWQSRMQRLYSKTVLPRTVRAADAVVTVSEFSKREIHDVLGVPKSKIATVYNGVDEYFIGDDPGTELELPDEYVLFVGAMNPRKNIRNAVEAFRAFKRRSDTSHELVLVGPSNSAVFEDLEIPADENVTYRGFVERGELKYAYRNADAFLFPSLYEGFGLPPLEAMACGTPVVASEAAALPEVLGDAAEFVDPHDVDDIVSGLDAVLADPEYGDELVERGRQRARKYRWPRVADDLMDVLEGVVES